MACPHGPLWGFGRGAHLRPHSPGVCVLYAGKQSALPEDIIGLPLSDLNVFWEFFIYRKKDKRGTKLLPMEKELLEKIRAGISD